MSDQLPDLLPAVKSWIIGLGIVGNRVAYRLPANPTQVPFARISRTGGGALIDSDLPLSEILCLVEFWGMQNKDYDAVRGAALALEQAAHAVNGPTATNGGGSTILGAAVLAAMDNPDPDTGWPRYVCTLRVLGRV